MKEIYRAYEAGIPIVGPTQIAKSLNVSKSTAYQMLKHLAQLGYGFYLERKGFVVNKKGIEEAKKIMRKHRILESFLADNFSMEACKACKEADKIDGCIGDDVINMIEEKFDYRVCPCGNTIPK